MVKNRNIQKLSIWPVRVAALSILLFLFTVPHTLEDFSVGEPEEAGVSVLLLAYGVAGLFALQGLALFWTGQQRSRGYALHAALGLLWPLAAGAAQLPAILAGGPYRSGTISKVLVIGIIVVGLVLCATSIQAFISARRLRKP